MGDLRDKYEVGDRVTYEINGSKYVTLIKNDGLFLDSGCKILKIERPTYEAIEEVKVEEKEPELLTEGEKAYLKWILESTILDGIDINKIGINRYFEGDKYTHAHILFITDDGCELDVLCRTYNFDGLHDYTNYTLEELGLEE